MKYLFFTLVSFLFPLILWASSGTVTLQRGTIGGGWDGGNMKFLFPKSHTMTHRSASIATACFMMCRWLSKMRTAW